MIYENQKIINSFPCQKRKPHHIQPDRTLILGNPDFQVDNNKIQTTNYNYINFLPKNLMIQLSKTPNLYFLAVGVLQSIPQISNTYGVPTIYLPLIVIIVISMLKDFQEEQERRRADKRENNQEYQLLNYSYQNNSNQIQSQDLFIQIKSQNLLIGHIIKLEEDDFSPADIILLYSSNSSNFCSVETKNLDGETNLKIIKTHPLFQQLITSPQDIIKNANNLKFFYEKPSKNMYQFNGIVEQLQQDQLGHKQQHNLDINNIIKKGSSLKNAEFALGIVIYTGHDTKLMMNQIKGKRKSSDLERKMYKHIIMIFVFLVLLCLLCSLYYRVYINFTNSSLKQENINEPDIIFVIRVLQWFLLLSNYVPISLLVSIDMVKFIQARLLMNDQNMFSIEQNRYATVNSSSLNEQLGIINYIFTDKTGTLTANLMKFRSLSAGLYSYGSLESHKEYLDEDSQFVDFVDMKILDHLKNTKHPNYYYLRESLLCLNICHSIFAEKRNNKIVYNIQSPDEQALIYFTKYIGFIYLGEQSGNIIIQDIDNTIIQFHKIYEFEFTFNRKRMSVLVQNTDNEYILYCKGADQVIYPRLSLQSPLVKQGTQIVLDLYSKQGLRTLCLARKLISKSNFQLWQARYEEINMSIKPDKQFLLEQLQEELEQEMELIGATGIEDTLQSEVPSTINSLKQAGIKIWMMTGDKIETAINIAGECSLIEKSSKVFIFDQQDIQEIVNQIESINTNSLYTLVITGHCFQKILDNEIILKSHFINFIINCDIVIGSRVTPKEKQIFVKLIKDNCPGAHTLAIGDGANDVSMIREADVGVGIHGREGAQASKASEYSICEFKFLKRLILYYGQEFNRKNSQLVLFNFYKNINNRSIIFWFGFLNAFSAQTIYDEWLNLYFNLIYTALPIVFYAILDEKFTPTQYLEIYKTLPNKLELLPQIYKNKYKSFRYSHQKFVRACLQGFLDSIIIFIVSILTLNNFITQKGEIYDIQAFGIVILTASVMLNTIKVLQLHENHYGITIFINILSVFGYVLFLYISNQFKSFDCYSLFNKTFGIGYFYISISVSLIITRGFDFVFDRFILLYNKSKEIKNQEQELQQISNQQMESQINNDVSNMIQNDLGAPFQISTSNNNIGL